MRPLPGGQCTDPDLASAVADQPGAGGQGGAAVPGHGGQQQGGAGQQAALQQDQALDGWVRVDWMMARDGTNTEW